MIKESHHIDVPCFFQPPPPSFEPTRNPAEIEEEYVRNPGVDIHADSGPSVQTVGVLETVAEVPATNEGRGSRKRRGKHLTTLYECDCGENISGSEVEQSEGLVECNKAGCETRWVSLQL